MQSATTIIPARSRSQAMDWSLVLVSQGIETVINPPTDDGSWGLLVAAGEYERARAVLQQYRLENRRWPWRREVLRPGLLFDWGSVAWVFLTIVFYWLQTQTDLRSAGRVDSAALADGQWWRLFSAMWLHADLGHLAANASIGLVLLGLVMGQYGTGAGLLAAYLAGAGGNLLAWLIWPAPHLSLGASGMVMGCLGLLTVQSFSFFTRNPRSLRAVIGAILGGAMLFVLLGLGPETDVLAHLGGFLAGLVIGIPLSVKPRFSQQTSLNLLCGLAFALLVILPWWLALKHPANGAHW
jgi:rhomboid protease GluP